VWIVPIERKAATYFEERAHDAIKRRSLRSLERLGYHVSLQEVNHADEEVVFQA
jgi:hypothetical protein